MSPGGPDANFAPMKQLLLPKAGSRVCFMWSPQVICTRIVQVAATFTTSGFNSLSLTHNSQCSKKIPQLPFSEPQS